MGAGEDDLYAPPEHVGSLDDCYFYHTTDLPGLGLQAGEWDLRSNVSAYLGHVPLAGKRVLDVGAASGFLTFHMEEQGAEVVSYDLSDRHRWDDVPYSGLDDDALDREFRRHLRRIRNAYWFTHRHRGSRARMVHGTVYAVPDAIGDVDVAVMAGILLHLRDPFAALHNAARLATDTVVVTDILPQRLWLYRLLGRDLPIMFLPRWRMKAPSGTWWLLPPETIAEFLGMLGFGTTVTSYHTQMFAGGSRRLYTVVGRRTGPTSRLAPG